MTSLFKAVGSLAALGVAGASGLAFGQQPRYNVHEPRTDISYTDSGKPMSKRRKRRLRGKGGAA